MSYVADPGLDDPNAGTGVQGGTIGGTNPRGDNPEGGRDGGYRPRVRPIPPEVLALELEDGRLVSDVVGEYGAGVFRGSRLRLSDGRLVEDVLRPYGGGFGLGGGLGGSGSVGALGLGGLGRFGGFKNTKDARAQFAVQQRMRKERLAALSRLGFGRTVQTGPQGVTSNVGTTRPSLDSG